MERIYIIGNKEDNFKHLGFPHEIVPSLNGDEEIDNWIIHFFQNKDVDKLIIDLSDNPKLFSKISLHIRLSLNELGEKSLIPLLFTSVSSLNSILTNNESWSHILTTKGAYFSSINQLKTEIQYVEGLNSEEYKISFLNRIHILPDEKIGRHSLANIWGAHAMDKAAGTNALTNNADFQKNKAKLYFKYVSAFNDTAKISSTPSKTDLPKAIDAKRKKILLIDDEADKGWETVLQTVFKTSCPEDFIVIKEKVKDYKNLSDNSKDIIENTSFDLYLVDLRLNGLEEEETLKTNEFSGMKVLRKIKSLNQGNQVIMFTASNKVWNLKALLDEGADGYYMKESPEFGFSDEFSRQNYSRFQEDVTDCFERNYLKFIWNNHRIIKALFEKKNPLVKYFKKTYEEQLKASGYNVIIINELDLIFNILKSSNKNRLNISMLSLFKILECVVEIFIYEKDDKLLFWNDKEVDFWKYSTEKKKYDSLKIKDIRKRYDEVKSKGNGEETKDLSNQLNAYKSTEHKIHALLLQELSLDDAKLHDSIHLLVERRNNYIHPKKKDKETKRFKSEDSVDVNNIMDWHHCMRLILEKL